MRKKLDLKAAIAALDDHTPTEMTFGELVYSYCSFHYDGADMRCRKWVDALGECSAWDVSTEQLDAAAHAMIGAGYKPSSVNRDTSTIGTIYKWAASRRLTPKGFRSPTLGLERFREDIRVVEVKNDEIDRLLAAAKAHRDRRFGVFVRLVVETGARRGEINARRWADVSLDACEITVLETKTGRPRVLHFSPATATLMRRVWSSRNDEDFLFEGRIKGVPKDYRRAWSILREKIGRPDLHLHDLRHHRAAEMLRNGTTIAVAAQVLGHSSLILQRRYGHLENATLRDAVAQSWRNGQ